MEFTKEKTLLVAVAVAVLVSALAFSYVEVLRPHTLLSVSNVHIEPQGYEDKVTGEWTGSFWVILMTTDMTDAVASYKFDNIEAEKFGNDEISGQKLVPQSEVLIKIDPQRPYWERLLERKSYMVYPKTYGMWLNKLQAGIGQWTSYSVSQLDASLYIWGSGYWTAHTPFKVTIYKNGEVIGTQTIDTVGGTKTVTIRNPSDNTEWVAIKDLGKLGTGYGEPVVGDIVYFSGDNVFKYSDQLIREIQYDESDYSYSNYWFGGGDVYLGHAKRAFGTVSGVVKRFGDDSPAHYFFSGAEKYPVSSNDFPGSYRSDDTFNYRVKPLAGSIFSDKSDGEYDPYGYSLVNYLKVKRNYATVDLDVWKQGVTKTASNNIRIYMPFGSMSSLITCQISTEIADTIVWKPSVANLKIVEVGDIGEVGDRKSCYVKVRQESTIGASGTLWLSIEPSDLEVSVNPQTIGVDLEPNEEATYTFEVVNLAINERVSATLRVKATNSLRTVTDEKTQKFTLLPKGVGATSLTVYTKDKETREEVNGIAVTIRYDSSGDTQHTSGGAWTWDLEGYQGTVHVATAETSTYKSASDSKQISQGINELTIELVKHGAPEPEFPWWVVIVVVAVVVAVAVIVIVYKKYWG